MKIYIEDEMIIDTEQVNCFKVLKKTKYIYELIAFCGGTEALLMKRSDDLNEIQDHLNNIMHHLFIGTEFLDLNLNEPYKDSDRRYYND
ncbi:MAG: hypothetical protein ACI4I9_00120 [Porcipelethomonas sp.]